VIRPVGGSPAKARKRAEGILARARLGVFFPSPLVAMAEAVVELADRVEQAEQELRMAESDRELFRKESLDADGLARAAGVRVVALEEALRDAKTTIRRAQMRYEHPLVEHPWGRCICVSCEGLRAIDAVLAASPGTPTEEET
jgi:hypothetical protein